MECSHVFQPTSIGFVLGGWESSGSRRIGYTAKQPAQRVFAQHSVADLGGQWARTGLLWRSQADTPNIDALAASGMKYLNAWSNGRSARRSHHHYHWHVSDLPGARMRSAVRLPSRSSCTARARLGYYCTNNSKTDYNLQVEPSAYGMIPVPRPIGASQGGSTLLRGLQFHHQPRKSATHAAARAIHDPARSACRPIIPIRRRSARLGSVLRPRHRNGSSGGRYSGAVGCRWTGR